METLNQGKELKQVSAPLFQAITDLASEKTRLILAIDGPSGSGKSTLGKLLQTKYQCPLICLDHFFLQPQQRTAERLAEPGGNVDYERFWAEVGSKLRGNVPFCYQIYDCQREDFVDTVIVEPSPILIIEGSYSHHPKLNQDYDLKVFLEIDAESQRERILKRNGSQMFERFLTQWIPMENAYFAHYQIKERSDLVLAWDK